MEGSKEGEGKFLDRRKEPRIAMKVPAGFKVLRQGSGAVQPGPELQATQTTDLSTQGLCLLTTQSLDSGDLVALELRFPYGEPVQVEAEVRWCRLSEDEGETGSYHVGMKFLDSGQEKNDALGKMLLKAFHP